MRIPSRRTALALVTAAAVAAAGAGAGGAVAAGPLKGHPGARHALKQRATRGIVKTIADYVGLTRQELREQHRAGKSFAQIATDQGKSGDGLKQAILAAAKARLDKAVAAGKLTPQREQAFLDRFALRLDRFLNRTPPAKTK